MIVQKDFNFAEEFFACLTERNEKALRRAKAYFEDQRVIWSPGTKTWLVLDCLSDEHIVTAERQLDKIDSVLTEKSTVTINMPVLTGNQKSDSMEEIELSNGDNNEE